jgi:hypothetical protein
MWYCKYATKILDTEEHLLYLDFLPFKSRSHIHLFLLTLELLGHEGNLLKLHDNVSKIQKLYYYCK